MHPSTNVSRHLVVRTLALLALVLSVTGAVGCAGAGASSSREPFAEDVAAALEQADEPVVSINDGEPDFTDAEIAYAEEHLGYERYSDLDELGRCGEAMACLGPETMPARDEERGEIYMIHPTGWQSVQYDFVEGESLYNRSHLIAWSLSAENANEENLITGTRYMNAESMQSFEIEVAQYIDETGNHVLYRVTPLFEDDELVARGVQMEAISLEDDGAGISFDVVCLNIQPGVEIDYATGDNRLASDDGAEPSSSAEASYILNTRSRTFHKPSCESVGDISSRNRRSFTGTREELIEQGYDPCGGCRP